MRKGYYIKTFLKIFFITMFIGILIAGIVFACAILGFMGTLEGIDIESLTTNYTSYIYYIDSETGEQKELTPLSSEQNKEWVDFSEIPQDMKDAVVSIEDERFFQHTGFDIKRTTKAFFTYVYNKIVGKQVTFGGSTITQQLIKNITQNDDKTPIRKIQEISQAVNLEKELSKEQILELYLNSIYLSQGCNGVQAAAKLYFAKDVKDLNLAECASIAGITQYPTLYDPLQNPDKNKEKQEIVLGKMLELGRITKAEYDEAIAYKLDFSKSSSALEKSTAVNSYFVDQVIEDVLKELKDSGYSDTLAARMLYSGGLKIITTYDPKIQKCIDEVYENTKNFYSGNPEPHPQSAIVIIDPYTGEIKGMAGGVGKKTASRTLNRATQSLRQPGSSIKPISVYSLALENNVITAASIYNDKAKDYSGWTPVNYDRRYNGNVSVRYAVQKSLNTVPVEILSEMGAEKSFNHLTENLGITSLVRREERSDGKVYSDIGLSQLALGGLTDGVSVLEMAAAYTPFVNKGIYTEPYIFTEVIDAKGKTLIKNEKNSKVAISESTAYITAQLLKEVVTSGTGTAARLSNGMFAAGKTGTTSDNKDKWFVGFTPYYVAAVWYGYDQPQPLKTSPCPAIWKNVMNLVHKDLHNKTIPMPSEVISISYCKDTGKLPGSNCETTSFYFTKGTQPKSKCNGGHKSNKDEEDLSSASPSASENAVNTTTGENNDNSTVVNENNSTNTVNKDTNSKNKSDDTNITNTADGNNKITDEEKKAGSDESAKQAGLSDSSHRTAGLE